jgi:hypothetical protein
MGPFPNLHPAWHPLVHAAGGLGPFVHSVYDRLRIADVSALMEPFENSGMDAADCREALNSLVNGFLVGCSLSCRLPWMVTLFLDDPGITYKMEAFARSFRTVARIEDIPKYSQRYILVRSLEDDRKGVGEARLRVARDTAAHQDMFLDGECIVGAGFIERSGGRITVDGASTSYATALNRVSDWRAAKDSGLLVVKKFLENLVQRNGREDLVEIVPS